MNRIVRAAPFKRQFLITFAVVIFMVTCSSPATAFNGTSYVRMEKGKVPAWFVTLAVKSADGVGSCSGVVTSATRITTAAHCLFDEKTGRLLKFDKLDVYFGAKNVSADIRKFDKKNWSDVEFRKPDPGVDIAIVILKKEKFSSALLPADTAKPLYPGTLYGSGTTPDRKAGEYVHKMEVNAISVDEKMYRAFAVERREGAVCGGDSGGPMVGQVNGDTRLFGVISEYVKEKGSKQCLKQPKEQIESHIAATFDLRHELVVNDG